jgi:hypothetical protein
MVTMISNSGRATHRVLAAARLGGSQAGQSSTRCSARPELLDEDKAEDEAEAVEREAAESSRRRRGGLLYARQRSLLGPIVSHVIVG